MDLHSTSNETDRLSTSPGGVGLDTPRAPVIVNVPWLASKSPGTATTAGEIHTAEPTNPHPRPFQPQSFVASMGVGVETTSLDGSEPGGASVPAEYGQLSAANLRQRSEPTEAPVPRVAAPFRPQIDPDITPSPRTSHPTWVGQQGETHFRVDPPQGRDATRPAVDAPSAPTPTGWQQQLVAIDQFLKDHGRVILLGAVMAAAVFVLGVLGRGDSSQGPPVNPAIPSPADRIAPVTSDQFEQTRPTRQIDHPRVAEALGPEGLAIREDRENSSLSESDISPIRPHFEGHNAELPESKSGEPSKELPYPTTELPSWEGAGLSPSGEAASNVAVIRSVRPLR